MAEFLVKFGNQTWAPFAVMVLVIIIVLIVRSISGRNGKK